MAAGPLSLVAIAAFLLLLINREALAGMRGPRAARMRQAMGVALPTLALVFTLAVATRIVAALSQ